MHAFILAGGFATRLWPLTESRPKPLLPLLGKPLLTHLVENIPKEMPITVSTNAVFAEAFKLWQSQIVNHQAPITILIEDARHDDHKLGALGATAQWIEREKINDDVLLLTGDNYIGFSLQEFIATAHPGTPLLAAHDIGDREKAKHFGTVITNNRETKTKNRKTVSVLSFEEKPHEPKTTLVSTGCSILPRATLPVLQAYAKEHPDNVGGIFEEFLRRGLSVDAFVSSDPWFDIGSFDAYLEATKALVGNRILQGEGCALERAQCAESIVLGNRCTVRNSTLQNVVLFDDCTVENADLVDCICDEDCTLNGVDLRRKMLRKGTILVRGG